jgi:hypothetical protein
VSKREPVTEEVAVLAQLPDASTTHTDLAGAEVQSRSGWNRMSSGDAGNARVRLRGQIAGEWLVVFLWTLIITRPYLSLDPWQYPTGGEFLSSIQTHNVWTRALDCGLCALWNGDVRGGNPAFIDPHGSMLHPFVILFTLGWGVINGSKLTLVAAFLMAGLAQWWLARELRVGVVSRVYVACMAVAAGNLAGRMELGAFGVVLSTAGCALAFAALVAFGRRPTLRAAAVLGVTIALAIVAGQGYMQVGFAFMLPAALFLVPWREIQASLMLRRFLLAGVTAILLAGPFLVPFLHFLPQFYKDVDPTFGTAQPIAFVPLNLVINDYEFFLSPALHKMPYPHLNVNYVGWVPVCLALLGLTVKPAGGRRVVACLAVSTFLAFWVASAEPLRWVVQSVPIQWLVTQFAGIRHPPQIAGLAVPPLLGLTAIGLDRLLSVQWPRLRVVVPRSGEPQGFLAIDMRWLLAIPVVLSLLAARSFGQHWIASTHVGAGVLRVVEALKTPDLQWVNTPFGEHFFVEPALESGLKLSMGIRTWNWKDRAFPEPVLEANRIGPPPGMQTVSGVVDGVPIYAAASGREYAVINHADGGRTICVAHGIGGDIDVSCSAPQAGLLTVLENSWSGWRATIDGQPVPLQPGQWLAANLPSGSHVVQFRYRPWDVLLGIVMCLLGIVWAVYLWFAPDPEARSMASMAHAG